MGVAGRIINAASWITTGIMLYLKFQQLQQSSQQIYSQLPPDLQSQWVDVFGDPTQQAIATPNPLAVTLPTVTKLVSSLPSPTSVSQPAPTVVSAPNQVSQVAAGV